MSDEPKKGKITLGMLFDYWLNEDARSFSAPVQMNLELTTQCPLRCPQCYVSLKDGEHLDREKALYFIREAAEAGVSAINLSGGETLAYPYLDELVRECSKLGISSAVALSGAYVTKERLISLIDAGVKGIYASLNGSTEEINKKSRDGYLLAINTLKYLKELSFRETHINFVMQKSNAGDIPAMTELAAGYGVKELVIMSLKPDCAHRLDEFPNAEQLDEAADFIESYKGPVRLSVESCFSILRSLIGERVSINMSRGIGRGCGAGRDSISVNIKGQLTPCRHLDLPEDNDSIMDYWRNSPVLKKLRSIEDMRDEPCRGCHYEKACLPCAAVANELRGDIMAGFKECPVALRD